MNELLSCAVGVIIGFLLARQSYMDLAISQKERGDYWLLQYKECLHEREL